MREFLFCIALLTLSVSTGYGKSDEWFQECQGDECGYASSHRGNADCQDNNKDCRSYALAGECRANPGWMLDNCKRSCGLCFSDELVDEPCTDMHTSCPQWAGELECFANPLYMSRACRKSCWYCVNATDLRREGVTEDAIRHRVRFSQTDFGLWQTQTDDLNHDKVKQVIVEMGRYAMQLHNAGPGTLCNNQFHDCAQLRVEIGGNCEADLVNMLSHCSLACGYCDIIDEFQACRSTLQEANLTPFGDLKAIQMHLFHDKDAQNLLQGFPDPLGPGEWIFSLEYSDLLKNSKEVFTELSSAVKNENGPLKWTNASQYFFGDLDLAMRPKRSGRVAKCDKSCQEKEPTFALLTSSISTLLQVKPEYLQPLEFVHYKRGERFSPHPNFRIHDSWKHSGHRIMTVFIVIQSPEEGGAFGFQEYDWLQIPEPKVLVWPNVVSAGQGVEGLRRMKSEQLPVVKGEMYGVYTTLREFPYDSENPCA